MPKLKKNEKPLKKALDLLSKRQYSRKKLKEKLLEKQFEEAEIELTLKRLEDLEYVNDRAFAKNIIRSYIEFKNFGKRRIYLELIKKGIPKEIANAELNKIDDSEETIKQSFDKFLKTHKSLPKEKIFSRALNYLMRRGFDYSGAKSVIVSHLAGPEED